MYYYRARDYGSNTGRFLSEDPLGHTGDSIDRRARRRRFVDSSPERIVFNVSIPDPCENATLQLLPVRLGYFVIPPTAPP